MICYLFSEPVYFLFSADIPELLYYSHIPVTIVVLLVGLFLYWHARDMLLNRLLLIISLSFSLWTLLNLILWTNVHSDFLLFVWTIYVVLFSFISIFSVYFIYVFLEKKDVSLFIKSIFLILLTPVLIFAPTYLNLTGFNIADCDAFGFEGFIYRIYYISLSILSMIWIFVLLLRRYRLASANFRKQIILMGIGIEFFLFSFFTLVFLAAYLTEIGIFADSRLELYGLFGMMVFMVFIAILIVQFKTFNVKLLGAQALVVALWFLVGSLLFVAQSTTTRTVAGITLLLTTVAGYYLVRSVKKEVKQREEIEKLAVTLEKANEKLKVLDKMKSEFVSIASHQLRSPLTSIRGYSSMLIEGSFGKLTGKALEAIERINESSRFMAASIEDYLNVSRIQAGNMKYEYSDFNIKDLALKVTDDTRQSAIKKGLLVTFKSDLTKQGIVHADIGKTRQVIDNLLNNAMKYTLKGTLSVCVYDKPKLKKVYVSITDTGIGMSKESVESMFEKFERASNANSVNVTGTGLGLYIARKMARDMGGDIIASSEGEGKGSTFTIELPLKM